MNIAVLGAGHVGSTLGKRFSQSGHQVRYGVPDPAKHRDLGAVSVKEAASPAEVVVLAVPWPAAESAVKAAGDLTGKVVVDCTNPLKPDLSGLALGFSESAAERVAGWARGAKVCKAFNTTGADNMANPTFGDRKAVMLVAGDDVAAKTRVLSLGSSIGFEAVDAGPLAAARLLEPLAMLWIHLAYTMGMGTGFAFGLFRRP
jgi:8-hydroxy-5-deazaflavin:NADPH oxidoreductase